MTPARLFVILAALFAALAIWFIPRMDASGDEPHYLVMAQSLWREHDLDLRDNYAREDWREFRGGPTEPHYAAPRKDGRPFPGHSPGLPFLLAPFYALGGRLACAILLGAMVAGVAAIAFRIALAEGLSSQSSTVAGLLAAGPPLAAFGLHVYTEAPSTLGVFAAYALLRLGRGGLVSAMAAALACALPFLHPKMALSSLALGCAAFAFRARIALPVFASVASLGALAYGCFWMSIFGAPTALGAYGGVPEDAEFRPLQALAGLLFDRAYGILPIAPAFLGLLLLKGPDRASEEQERASRVELAIALSILLPALVWRMWWGGQSPPARFLAPMIPFLALGLARRFEKTARPAARRVVMGALVWSWGLFLFAALQPDRLLFINRRVRPTRIWEALWPGGPLDGVFPDLARPESSDWTLVAGWGAMLIIAAWATRRRPRVSTSSSAP